MKLYVLVRKDLHPSQQAVQCGHAVAEFCLWQAQNYNLWNNGTLVYLGVDSKFELKDWYEKLNLLTEKNLGIITPFHEEYFNNEMTAFAVAGLPEVMEAVKSLKLI